MVSSLCSFATAIMFSVDTTAFELTFTGILLQNGLKTSEIHLFYNLQLLDQRQMSGCYLQHK